MIILLTFILLLVFIPILLSLTTILHVSLSTTLPLIFIIHSHVQFILFSHHYYPIINDVTVISIIQSFILVNVIHSFHSIPSIRSIISIGSIPFLMINSIH